MRRDAVYIARAQGSIVVDVTRRELWPSDKQYFYTKQYNGYKQ